MPGLDSTSRWDHLSSKSSIDCIISDHTDRFSLLTLTETSVFESSNDDDSTLLAPDADGSDHSDDDDVVVPIGDDTDDVDADKTDVVVEL